MKSNNREIVEVRFEERRNERENMKLGRKKFVFLLLVFVCGASEGNS
jgi:hypothetical protein